MVSFPISRRKLNVPLHVSSRTSGRLLWYGNITIVVLPNVCLEPGWYTYNYALLPGSYVRTSQLRRWTAGRHSAAKVR